MAGIATGQVVTFSVGADESEGFTDMEVYRSRDGEAGPFYEITGPDWAPARLTSTAKNALLNGKQLKLRLMENQDVTVTFSGADPTTPASAASQIQAQGLGLITSYVDGSLLVIETVQAGANVTLRALESDGVALLGLSSVEPDAVGFGTNARIPVTAELTSYSFSDPHGSKDYFYRVRFSNRWTSAVSDYSDTFSLADYPSVSTALMVEGVVSLVDLEGKSLEDVEVKVRLRSATALLGSSLVAQSQLTKRTDEDGEARFWLPRGSQVTVVITGTTIARDVTVPSDSSLSSFDLLDPAYGSDDAFSVQRPELNYAVKRTL